MVLEHLFPEEWLEKKARYAFFLGAGYSIIGIFLSSMLFAKDPALPAVAFTSLLLLPELYKMFSIEERQQSQEKRYNVRTFWKDNGDFYRVFLFLFLGILIVYSLGSIMLPDFSVNTLFREQVAVRGPSFGAAGHALSSETGTIVGSLLGNNITVFIAVFLVALLAGDGAIFLIVWNASVWGTIFGVTVRNAASFGHQSVIVLFVTVLFIVIWHVLLESSGYILAAISGGLISKGTLMERFEGTKFARVFKDNMLILLIGLGVLALGAVVEALVLVHSAKYQEIIALSYMATFS